MNSKEFMNLLVPVTVNDFTCYYAQQVNKALVHYHFTGDPSKFTQELLEKYVASAAFAKLSFQMQIVEFMTSVLERDYKPQPLKGFKSWAIDGDGVAYYYELCPVPGIYVDSWLRSNFNSKLVEDNAFDKEKYKHMWQGNEWRKTLVTFDES